jgi:hypothetical protein
MDRLYHEYVNLFKLKKIKIGPFYNKNYLNLKIVNFKNHTKFNSGDRFEKINFKHVIKEEIIKGKEMNYSIFEFNEDFLIDCDVKFIIEGKKINFYFWINLFFSTLDIFIHKINDLPILTQEKPERLKTHMPRSSLAVELGDLSNSKKKKENIIKDEPLLSKKIGNFYLSIYSLLSS